MNGFFKISLVQHGETLLDREHVIQGQLDTELSDAGRRQAQLVADRLSSEKFTRIFSSDLVRAVETAKIIITAHNSDYDLLVQDRRLRERGFGCLEGKLLSEYKAAAQKSNLPLQMYTPAGGETLQQVRERVKKFLDDLCLKMVEPGISYFRGSTEDVSVARHLVTKSVESLPRAGLEAQTGIKMSRSCTSFHSLDHDSLSDLRIDKKSSLIHKDSSSPIYLSKLEHQNSSYSSVLVVSHGVLLRELTALILERYHRKGAGQALLEPDYICSSASISQFTLGVFQKDDDVGVSCIAVHVVNNTSHLVSSSENVMSCVPCEDMA